MEENKSILHELYVFSEWKPEPEYIQKPDSILPENISVIWRWLRFMGPKKSLIDSVTAYLEKQQKWHIALGDEGKAIAVLTDNILEIRTKRSEYATIAARTTVNRDPHPQWRKLVWSPDCSFIVLAYGNGVVSFFDLTATNLFNIPTDCSKPGGLECSDTTHAVADIIFMPVRVKDTKWNWEVLIVTYNGRLRGYLVSQTEGCKLYNMFSFSGGVSAVTYGASHCTLYVAGLPRPAIKDPASSLTAGITTWRILNDSPFYKMSVVSDELEAQLANESFHLSYIPFLRSKHLPFIVRMELSPDGSKLVCLHCNGDVSVWRLPLLKLLYRWPLVIQPLHDLRNPLISDDKSESDQAIYHISDVNWWSNEEIILSRFSGAVSICNIENMVNILGKKPEFFQGAPKITCAHGGVFMVLECESNVLPAKKSRSEDSLEMVNIETPEKDDTMLELTKELIKSILYAITDIETFQPKPRRITIVSRVYRLLGVKSTTPNELLMRKIESGSYKEALALADTFNLDSDLVYQQQWRKNPVSTDAIQNYLSKVSKKIWAVHQCVDRIPETLASAKELLQFGLELTNQKILDEINQEHADQITDHDDITLEHLNAYTSELLRCRHVMLFYKERLSLYEAILKFERSSYVKDEYDRLRSNSIVLSAIEVAKEGRINALTCLWPHIKTTTMQLTVLDHLPETIDPLEYQHLLPTKQKFQWFDRNSPIKVPPTVIEYDWCRKEMFRPIWSSNWSDDSTPETEVAATDDLCKWYDKRAREIEQRCGIVSHALKLIELATVGGGVEGLKDLLFHLTTLNTLIYDINVEGVTLSQLEKMSILEITALHMKMSTTATIVADLKKYAIPLLKRYENFMQQRHMCLTGLLDYLESISVNDLSPVLVVLQAQTDYELDQRTRLDIAERCLYAHTGTDQLDKACDLLNTILKESSDSSIGAGELFRRATDLERVVWASGRLVERDVRVTLRDLNDMRAQPAHAANLLTRLARSCALGEKKPTQQDWEKLLNDILQLQSTLFNCISKEQCHEIYASALLTSGDAASINLAADVLTCAANARRNTNSIDYKDTVKLVSNAAKEYFNSASSLNDPALELARCCLTLIKDDNEEIRQELDMISALQILSSFDLSLLPIQVRLSADKISLIEECLKADASAYLASHKLLKLATLLRIAGDDEQTREGQVLQLVGEYASCAGVAGGGAATEAARRLAALRYAPAAALISFVAMNAHMCADRHARRDLYAAAVTNCAPDQIEDILTARLELELEGLRQLSATFKERSRLVDRCPSTEEEFADAVTTPVIEKKDLVASPEKKIPVIDYVLETIQNKFSLSDSKACTLETTKLTVHCQEFYRSLYPEHDMSTLYYSYDRFSIPDAIDSGNAISHSVLKWFFIQNSLGYNAAYEMETEVLRKCAELLLYKDTPLSVACLLRSTKDTQTMRFIDKQNTDTALSCALYAALIKCNSAELGDDVYFTKPSLMARTTLKYKNASEELMELIHMCAERLAGMGQVEALRALGHNVNRLLFNADEDYRREIIYRVAKSGKEKSMTLACLLAAKYDLDELEVWLLHAAAALPHAHFTTESMPRTDHTAHARIKEALWPGLAGTEHTALINYFTLLKAADEKAQTCGLTAAEHIKLLKKVKAASPELDYKLLLEQPSAERFSAHILSILKPDNVGMVGKFLRCLPPAFKIPVPVNVIYTQWLTKHFFSVPDTSAASKKWMQQYRTCASYFNKLSKEDLVNFVAATCFSDEAIKRVPACTRNLMITQAVDYCQQEQGTDLKINKNEQTWAQVGQELTRWARFLDNFHSTTIQNLIENSGVDKADIWPEIEKSHGDTETIVQCLGRLVMSGELRAAPLNTLLQCLHVPADAPAVLAGVLDHTDASSEMKTLVSRVTQYHKGGVKFSEDFLERLMQKASQLGLSEHVQSALLPLSPRQLVQDSDDLLKVAQYTLDLLQKGWPDCEFAAGLTVEDLMTEEGRQDALLQFLELADDWSKLQLLADVLDCWPPVRLSDANSSHCEFLDFMLCNTERRQCMDVIRGLFRRPILAEEEVKLLIKHATEETVLNTIWIILLSKYESCMDDIEHLLCQHGEYLGQQKIEVELTNELLKNGMLIKLVPTPLYYIMIRDLLSREDTDDDPPPEYPIPWIVNELYKAGLQAEAGHLHLMSLDIPMGLLNFSQTILYCKNTLSKTNL